MEIKEINGFEHIPYSHVHYKPEEMVERSQKFYDWMETRRSVRDFSDKPVPKEVIENILKSASTAPSGAHKQPWTFCVVSNPEIKKQILLVVFLGIDMSSYKALFQTYLE